MNEKAAIVGRKIKAEKGIQQTVATIENFFGSKKTLSRDG
jgi:hypothetical protein